MRELTYYKHTHSHEQTFRQALTQANSNGHREREGDGNREIEKHRQTFIQTYTHAHTLLKGTYIRNTHLLSHPHMFAP